MCLIKQFNFLPLFFGVFVSIQTSSSGEARKNVASAASRGALLNAAEVLLSAVRMSWGGQSKGDLLAPFRLLMAGNVCSTAGVLYAKN